MRISTIMAGIATAVLSAPGWADPIPMDTQHWDVEGNAGFETIDGRSSLRLGSGTGQPRKGGQANIKGLQFATGVLEFDIRLPNDREFSGPVFRQTEDGSAGEIIYFRPHLNGKPDAIQYTPVVNGNLAWQIFTGEGFEAEVTYPIEQWMHVRVDIYPSSATLAIDGKPVLRIPGLKNGPGSGALGFAALMGGTHIANLEVKPIADYQDPHPVEPPKPLPAGTVRSWQVAGPLAETDGFSRAAEQLWTGMAWQPVAVETNGIANLSKVGPDGDQEHTFIARFRLRATAPRLVPMQFGFSDKVRIYLNGKPMYEGADLQFSRDYRFLGHVGFWDGLFLPLNAGLNDIAFVVTDDTNGGTAAAARIEDPSITIE